MRENKTFDIACQFKTSFSRAVCFCFVLDSNCAPLCHAAAVNSVLEIAETQDARSDQPKLLEVDTILSVYSNQKHKTSWLYQYLKLRVSPP